MPSRCRDKVGHRSEHTSDFTRTLPARLEVVLAHTLTGSPGPGEKATACEGRGRGRAFGHAAPAAVVAARRPSSKQSIKNFVVDGRQIVS